MFKKSLVFLTCFALLTACGGDDKDKEKGATGPSINMSDYEPAEGELAFDKYRITPPEGYVYIPEEYEESIKRIDRLFIRFFQNIKEAGKLGTKDNKLVLTFGLFPRRFDNIDSYYKNKAGDSKFFRDVPKKYKEVRNKGRWNCRFFDRSYNPALSCGILGDERFIKVDAVGASKKEILGKISLVNTMLESLRIVDAAAEAAAKAEEEAKVEEEAKAAEEKARIAEEESANQVEEQQLGENGTDSSESSPTESSFPDGSAAGDDDFLE